jgi:hypothetical protein
VHMVKNVEFIPNLTVSSIQFIRLQLLVDILLLHLLVLIQLILNVAINVGRLNYQLFFNSFKRRINAVIHWIAF